MQQAAATSQTMPADHPPLGAQQGTPDPQAVREQVTAVLEKARNEPKNFEAQVKAAELYYQIHRYDQAIEYLLKANQLKPTDYRTVTLLGVVNLDAGHYDTAEKWYQTAMKMKSDDVMVLSGLAYATLQKGDAKAAEDAIAKLEKVSSKQRGSAAVQREAGKLEGGQISRINYTRLLLRLIRSV